MIVIDLKEGINQLHGLRVQLTGRQLSTAINRAINRTALIGRTEARRAVKSVYNIPQKNLSGINIVKSTPVSLTAKVYASGKPIPMDAFAPRFQSISHGITISRRGEKKVKNYTRKRKSAKGLSIEVFRGQRQLVPFAFMAVNTKPRVFARGRYNMSSFGFIKRTQRVVSTGNDLPIKPLISVSVGGAVLNPGVIRVIERRVSSHYPVELERQLRHVISQIR